MKVNKKWLSIIAVSLIGIHLLTEPVLRGLYYLVLKGNGYLALATPLIHTTKYFAIALFLTFLFRRFSTLTSAGKKFVPVILILSVAGLLTTSLWFNAVDEEKIVRYRILVPIVKTWEEVDYVSSAIFMENPMSRPKQVNQLAPLKLYTKYHIHFNDGSKINVWNNLDAMYELHQMILENNVNVKYATKNLAYFDQNYSSHFKKALPKAHSVFGVEVEAVEEIEKEEEL